MHYTVNKEKFEDAKGVIRSRKSEGQTIQWPEEKGQTMICKTLHRKHRKQKIEQHKHY